MRIRPRRNDGPHPTRAAAKKADDILARDVKKIVAETQQELVREQRIAAGLPATPGILERIAAFFQALGRLFSSMFNRMPATAVPQTNKPKATEALDLAKTAHIPADGASASPRSDTDPAESRFSPTEFADDVTDPKSGVGSDDEAERRSPHE